MTLSVHRLNESFSVIDGESQELMHIFNYLRVELPGAYFDPLVKCGMKSPYEFFASVQHEKLLVSNGHLQILQQFGITAPVPEPEYTEVEIDEFLKDVKSVLPFDPYDFQEKAFKESILNVKQITKMCTGAGKSLTIALIAEFFRRKGKKGLLLVPNINLLTQFKNDISDYILKDLHGDTHTIGGGQTVKHFNSTLTISTWQSLQNWHNDLNELDYVITDECLHPETIIKTNKGSIQIQDIKVGTKVLTINEETKEHEYKPVIKVHKNISDEQMFKLETDNSNTIKITGNHKVMTTTGWKRTDELSLSDNIILEDSNIKLKSIKEIKYTGDTYNLHVKGNHNYFANNINVSNCHRFASEETSAIVKKTINCKYKWGFTGTLPESPVAKMQLFGLFGLPKTYITSRELIDRGLATPVIINTILLKYNSTDKSIFKHIEPAGKSKNKYPNQLQFIKDHEKRNEFITNLSCKLTGTTLVLGQHVDHLKAMYLDIMNRLFPEITDIPNKLITGKHSFEFQKKYGVYYISGSDDAKTRELTRNILEEDHYNIILTDGTHISIDNIPIKMSNIIKQVSELLPGDDITEYLSTIGDYSAGIIKSSQKQNKILVSGYQLLSTGVNIKKLHNMILASPMKSYNTVTQSIGRLMRLHKDKKVANVFDLVDVLNVSKKPSGLFYNQYKHRVNTSYNPEDFPIKEIEYNLF